MDKDIRIYGTLLNYTTDDKIAYAKQVFDEEFEGGTKQSEINKRVRAISTNGTKTVVDSDLQVTSGHKITAPNAEFNGASIGNGTIIDLVVTDSAEFDCNIRPGESNITIGTQDTPWHDGYFEDIHVDGWVYTDFVKANQEVVAGNVIADYRVTSQEIGTDKITSKLGGGNIVVSGSLIPEVTNTITLGDVNHLWKGLYVNDIHATNLNGVDLADFFDEVETLIGTGEGSISKMIDDKIATIISDAPSSLDTLKEISDWISSHQNDASAMNSAIQSLQSTVDGFSNKISTDKIYANQYYIGYDKDGNTEYYGLISYNNGSLTIGGSNVDDVTIQPSNLYARDIHANNIYTKDEIDEMFSSVDPTIPSRLSVDQIVATGAEFRSADIGHGSITDLIVTDSATFDCNIRPGDGSLTVGTQENPWYEVYTTTLHADNVYTKDEINTLIQNAVDSLTQQIEDLQDRVYALEHPTPTPSYQAHPLYENLQTNTPYCVKGTFSGVVNPLIEIMHLPDETRRIAPINLIVPTSSSNDFNIYCKIEGGLYTIAVDKDTFYSCLSQVTSWLNTIYETTVFIAEDATSFTWEEDDIDIISHSGYCNIMFKSDSYSMEAFTKYADDMYVYSVNVHTGTSYDETFDYKEGQYHIESATFDQSYGSEQGDELLVKTDHTTLQVIIDNISHDYLINVVGS